mmetsp:Transcript_23002/g.55083  ORF Transcript_23002/g.55083 Transcript_23002/m.55083 type:complete len:196 (-) Transcript_23002:136-723(-)
MERAADSPIICSRKRDAKQGAMPRSPSLLAMTPSCPPTPSSLPTGWPHVDSTPSSLTLLEAESDMEKVGPECSSAIHRAAALEFATALHTVLLVFALFLFRKASDMVACMVALILLALALSHPAVVYVASQWSRWQRGVGFASDLLQEKHAVCANAACARRIMQQGQDVYLAYDAAFCSARCRSKRIETVPSGDV